MFVRERDFERDRKLQLLIVMKLNLARLKALLELGYLLGSEQMLKSFGLDTSYDLLRSYRSLTLLFCVSSKYV